MIGFYLSMLVLPAAIIALAVILAHHARLRPQRPPSSGPSSGQERAPGSGS